MISCRSGLSMIHFNARSLKANYDFIRDYVYKMKKDVHIIAISETWLESAEENKHYMLDNYSIFSTARSDKRGGDVTLYINEKLKVKQIERFSLK